MEFRISIVLEVPDEDGPRPTILLSVRYPDEYPDRLPHLDILAPPNAPPHPHFSLSTDRDGLLCSLAEKAEESIGMAMVFTLVTALKELAEALVEDRLAAASRSLEEKALEAEREDNRKFQGQLVTPEAFLAWRSRFLTDMAEAKAREEDERAAEMKKAKIKEPVRLTGRQLWERGLVAKADEEEVAGRDDDDYDDDVGDEAAPAEGMAKLKIAN